ncbi:Ankyrin repeat domain containing protein [Pandoravirus quercus]|uniref:Ankyrin repeat domain containing protein n=1 Tax=Pandoravirus quercus TaxID=2107709 RepID=A0A2U7UAB6_9VIRU|nr:Ankyrin repeat domain containing protein [Pandoravirus quercus]AVK75320.1 Ankyrin repeat domain containing protein [Pandoravirus quercus]
MIATMPSEIAAHILAYLDNVDFCSARLAHRWFLVHTDDEITQQRRLAVWSRHDLDLCRKGDTVAVAALAAAGHYFTSCHLAEAAAHGHIKLVDLLLGGAVSHALPSSRAINCAASAGQLAMVIHLHDAVGGLHPPATAGGRYVQATAMDYAAGSGHLDIVEWLHENTDRGCTTHAMDMAAASGHTHILQWLHEHRTEGCTIAAGSTSCSGNVQTVAWLFGHLSQEFLDPLRVFRCAAWRGYIDILCWLHANGFVPPYSALMAESAASHGRLDILRWMAMHLADAQFDASTAEAAARNGHLDIVEWLYDNNYRDVISAPQVLTVALTSGHMNVVNYLCVRQPDIAVLDTAIDDTVRQYCVGGTKHNGVARGRFDALEWLRMNRPGTVPSQFTMDFAIYTGQLDVVQWLHTHYGVGCAPRSINSAAATGCLELVDWVWTTYSHAPTLDGLNGAAEQDHVHILDWLRTHFPHLTPTTETINYAAGTACLNALQWIHRNHPNVRTDDSTLTLAIPQGDLSVVRFLCETYALEVTEATIAEADRREHFAVVDYLRSVRAAHGPLSA